MAEVMTDQQRKEYLKNNGVKCPYCGSKDVEGGSIDVDSGRVSQDISCTTCGAEWMDHYTLTGVSELSPPNNEG